MTMPALPPEGSTDWYDHYAGVDSAVRSLLAGGGGSPGTGGGGLSTAADLARMKILGPRFAVAGPSDWLVSTSTGRTVSIAAGSGIASGDVWTTTAAQTVTLDANTGSGTRYDLIVARWTWTTDGSGNITSVTRAFAVVKGTNGAAPPTTRTLNPGTLYEGLVAIVAVRAGVTTLLASDLTDMRVYGGSGGSLVRAVGTFMSYVDAIVGTEVLVLSNGTLGWQRFIYHGASVWRATRDVTMQADSSAYTITAANGTTAYGLATIVVPDPGYTYELVVSGMMDVSANTGTAVMVRARLDGTTGTAVSGEGIRSGQLPDGELVTLTLAPYKTAALTGSHTVYLVANRMFGTGSAACGTGHLNVLIRPV